MRYFTHQPINPNEDQVKVAVYTAEAPSPESQDQQRWQTAIAVSLIVLSGLVAYLGS